MSEGGPGKKMSVAPISVKKQEYHEPMVCLSKCTVEPMEKCERVDSVHMK